MKGVLALVHERPHPAHAAWARAAGLDLHRWLPRAKPYLTMQLRDLAGARAMPRADVLVAEGGGPAGSCVLAKRLGRAESAILLAADETWARLRRGVPVPLPATERLWWSFVGRRLDGAIAVSPYVRDDLAVLYPELPIRVVRPFVEPRMREACARARPRLDGTRILHLANESPKNGTALALAAFRHVREEMPGATLHLVGEASERWAAEAGAGVVAHGRVPDLVAHLESADLFLLPGLGQACPVSTMEAMAAGLPALVTTETGTKDFVEKVDARLVAAPEARSVAQAALGWLARAPVERREMGEAARRAVSDVTPARQEAAFVEALRDLTGRAPVRSAQPKIA